MRTALDLQQVRSVRATDLQQLVADVAAVSSDIARQSGSWQRFGDQLSAIGARLDALETQRASSGPAQPGSSPA
jgi:hypothetical protein